ncbi:Thiol:disulfide oxidoreductase related to ResA [hydrothermal vent metagenome]|uniref:Thiol:disulfide oxidoreductase related to ResA n=1 Tax=hydrothermal vent metagenome TaxID=652676 RepID=A0A3B1CAZ9_9ZZZZ
MNDTINENVRWIPFGALALSLLIVSGFWKIQKSMEVPPPPMSETAAGQSKQAASKMEGKKAPDFTLSALGGGEISLSDYRGKVVFLNVWATWCPPCREEMPSMQKLYEHFKGKDFVMLTISIDENKSLVEPFMKELGLTFPVVFDPDQKVASIYKITGVPETFIIDKTGIITHHLLGPGEWNSPGIVSAFEEFVKRPAKS